jgi:hypothetical protein
MAPKQTPQLFIEWESLPLNLEDLRAANALLERLGLDEEAAIAAVRCAAFIRPRMFATAPETPSKAVRQFNQKYPPGTPITCWPNGRDEEPVKTLTASVAFDLCGLAAVLVQHEDATTVPLADVSPHKQRRF